MADNQQSKTLEKPSKGIRSRFGLFSRAPEPAAMTQDQEIFVRRLEEVLDPEPARSGYVPEPPRSFTSPAEDASQFAAPAFALTTVMEPVPVMELVSDSQVDEKVEPATELAACPESEWRNIVQAVRAGAALATEPATPA